MPADQKAPIFAHRASEAKIAASKLASSERRRATLPPPISPTDLLVIAGEHSGDEHAARLVRDLRSRQPGLTVAALGGPALAAAGAQLLHDLTSSSVVGLVEVIRNLSFFRALYDDTLRWIAEHSPRAVLLVDYPGLNLRLAEGMRARGLSAKGGGKTRALYYISPQIWAWKSGRRFAMARNLDAMAVIFPFEVACYADTALPVEFVGHPFTEPGYEPPVAFDPAGPLLLLPGSRKQAVARIFPALLAGYRAFGERPAVALYPSEEVGRLLRRLLRGQDGERIALVPVEGGAGGERPVAAAAVLTSSGTMSMHCALAGIPGAVVYRANFLTYLVGSRLVRVPHLGIANLLLKEPMYPEFIQGAATPAALSAELHACVHDPIRREDARAKAGQLRAVLSRPSGGTAVDWLQRELEKAPAGRP